MVLCAYLSAPRKAHFIKQTKPSSQEGFLLTKNNNHSDTQGVSYAQIQN
jgi:hypothetical protein